MQIHNSSRSRATKRTNHDGGSPRRGVAAAAAAAVAHRYRNHCRVRDEKDLFGLRIPGT